MSTKLIRRALIASGLFIGAAAGFSPTAFADTGTTDDSAIVNISGTVASTLGISASAPNTNLDLAPGQTNTTVRAATLAMGTNNSTGLTLNTSGSFVLTNDASGSVTIPFTVGIGVGSAPASTYGATTTTDSGITINEAKAATTEYGMWIQYSTATGFQDPGSYTGQVTLSLSDN